MPFPSVAQLKRFWGTTDSTLSVSGLLYSANPPCKSSAVSNGEVACTSTILSKSYCPANSSIADSVDAVSDADSALRPMTSALSN